MMRLAAPAAIAGTIALLLLLSPGTLSARQIHVRAGGDLQAALDAARPGDTILLEPGATFVGNFRLPVHGGTEHVTVRSAANDASLPGDGERISPADAPRLPKLTSPNSSPVIATRPGAAFWRLMFIEVQGTPKGYSDLVTLGDGSAAQSRLSAVPHDLILDRVYVHGDPLNGQKRGIALNSANTTVVNSYISDIKAIGQDSQALGGWNGPGPYRIENNHFEAAGEVVLFGGGDPAIPDLVPSDIVLRRNILTRPLRWRDPILPPPGGIRGEAEREGALAEGEYVYRVVARRPAYGTVATSAGSEPVTVKAAGGSRIVLTWQSVPDAEEYRVYVQGPKGGSVYWTVNATRFVHDGATVGKSGNPPRRGTVWQVKNLLELKNARRVQIDRNRLEHNWAQAQIGVALVLTPRNQNGGCDWCVVEDVTFEHNIVRGVAAGISILGRDDQNPSEQTTGIRIRHNEFLDIGKSWGGSGYFLYITGGPRDVIIDHNTIISPDGAGVVTVAGPPVMNFVLTNNVARHNRYGIIGRDHGIGLDSIQHFFPGATIAGNVFAGGGRNRYPPGVTLTSIPEFESRFVDYADGNFALKTGSPWTRAGTDDVALGATLPRAEVGGSPSRR